MRGVRRPIEAIATRPTSSSTAHTQRLVTRTRTHVHTHTRSRVVIPILLVVFVLLQRLGIFVTVLVVVAVSSRCAATARRHRARRRRRRQAEGACGAPWRALAAAALYAGAAVSIYWFGTALPAGLDAAGSTTGLSIICGTSAHAKEVRRWLVRMGTTACVKGRHGGASRCFDACQRHRARDTKLCTWK